MQIASLVGWSLELVLPLDQLPSDEMSFTVSQGWIIGSNEMLAWTMVLAGVGGELAKRLR